MATGKGGGSKAQRQTATSPRRRVSNAHRLPLITMLTDFGTADHFVAAMKGVILTANRRLRIVDITHDIPPQDVQAAAFSLLAAHASFPPGTIHVAVVDPGVGSDRIPLALEAGGQVFVGPNNGLFSYICDRHHAVVRAITNEGLFRHPVSSTFHGRDVFAPVAAAIASGTEVSSLGPKLKEEVRLEPLAAERSTNGKVRGRIIHIDRFGNCITNLTSEDLHDPVKAVLTVNSQRIGSFRRFFAEDTDEMARAFAYWGSAGFLEIGVRNASAAKVLKVNVGDPVTARVNS